MSTSIVREGIYESTSYGSGTEVNFSLSGTFSADMELIYSENSGLTWQSIWSGNRTISDSVRIDTKNGNSFIIAWRCNRWISGTIVASLSRGGDSDIAENLVAMGVGRTVFPSGDTTRATDTTAIQAAIDACNAAGGGVVRLLPAAYYAANLTPRAGVTVCGAAPTHTLLSNCPDLNFTPVSGTIIYGDAVAVTGITPGNPTTITVSGGHGISNGATVSIGGAYNNGTIATDIGPTVNGIKAVATVINSTTLTIPIDTTGKTYTQGAWIASSVLFNYNSTDLSSAASISDAISNFWIKDVGLARHMQFIKAGAKNAQSFFGGGLDNVWTDVCTYIGFEVTNFQHWNWHIVKMYRAQKALSFGAYHEACQPGNSQFYDFYAYIFYASNPSFAARLWCAYTGSGSTPALNYCSFYRPQINMFGGSKTLNAGNALWKLDGVAASSAYVNSCTFYDADTEGNAENDFYLTDCSQTRIITKGPSLSTDVVNCVKAVNSKYTFVDSTSTNVTINVDANCDPSWVSGMIRCFSGQYRMRGMYYSLRTQDDAALDNNTHFSVGVNDYAELKFDSQSTRHFQTNLLPLESAIKNQASTKTNWGRYDFGNDQIILVTASSTTQSLPDPTGTDVRNMRITFKNDAGVTSTTINSQGTSKTIDGAASKTLSAAYNFITVISNGTEWKMIATG